VSRAAVSLQLRTLRDHGWLSVDEKHLLHLSPEGADTNPGTKEAPFATLDQARKAIRTWGKQGEEPGTVHLRGGVYYLDTTFILTADDSGMLLEGSGDCSRILPSHYVNGSMAWTICSDSICSEGQE